MHTLMQRHYAQSWVQLIPGLKGVARGAGVTQMVFPVPQPQRGPIRDFAPGYVGLPHHEPHYGPGYIGDLRTTYSDEVEFMDVDSSGPSGVPGSVGPSGPDYNRDERDTRRRNRLLNTAERRLEALTERRSIPVSTTFVQTNRADPLAEYRLELRADRRQRQQERRDEVLQAARNREVERPFDWGVPNHRKRRVGRGRSPEPPTIPEINERRKRRAV